MKKKKTKEAIDTLEIYNDEQKFFINIVENATASEKQLQDSLKLQNWIKKKAQEEVEALADNNFPE